MPQRCWGQGCSIITGGEVLRMIDCAGVKQQVRIEDVVGRYVALKRHGTWYLGRCPFHDDHHPSLVVWPKTGHWKCMTCSPKRDDVIGFVAQMEHCSLGEAADRLAQSEHLTRPVSRPRVQPQPHVKPSSTALASLADRDRVYRQLLHHWGLSAGHRQALQRRRLASTTVAQAQFASVIPGPIFDPGVAGIPGFVGAGGRWRIHGPLGIAIPVSDIDGRIAAIHVRTDGTHGGKYRWLSTADLPGGAASGAPIHVVRGLDAAIWITEGPLKAIVAQQFLGHTVLGVPGVYGGQAVTEIVAALRPSRVVMAFDQDADPATAQLVHAQMLRLATALRDQGADVVQGVWSGPKGLDDALVAGSKVTFAAIGESTTRSV